MDFHEHNDTPLIWQETPPTEAFSLEQFLKHFYSILELYLLEKTSLNQAFSLYIHGNMKTKSQAQEFREKYVQSFEKLLLQQSELSLFFEVLEQEDKE